MDNTAIGIRANPKEIYFAISSMNGDVVQVTTKDKVIVPFSYNTPERLNFIRKTFIDIINQYEVTKAGIRLTESNSRSLNIDRISIEAVIQELFSSCSVQEYFGGNISKISRLLELKNRSDLKKFFNDNKIENETYQFLEELKKEERESILTSFAALNL